MSRDCSHLVKGELVLQRRYLHPVEAPSLDLPELQLVLQQSWTLILHVRWRKVDQLACQKQAKSAAGMVILQARECSMQLRAQLHAAFDIKST